MLYLRYFPSDSFSMPAFHYELGFLLLQGPDVVIFPLRLIVLSCPSQILSKRNTTFYGGDSVSMIDYMIWPWFERLEAFELTE